jgi:hypothetical protein
MMSKVQAILAIQPPRNRADLMTWMGMTGYYRRHVLGYAEKSAPLRVLLAKDVAWTWGVDQQAAFESLRADLASDRVLRTPQA